MKTILMKLVTKLVKGNWGKILPMLLTGCAEGKFGPKVKAIYWFAAGKKTVTGMVLIGFAYGLEAVCNVYPEAKWGCQWSQYLVWVGGLLTTLGLADGGNRSPWPETPDGKAPWQVGK